MTTALKPYPAYKDSGIEWLGAVPKHWDTIRFRFLLNLEKGNNKYEISENENNGNHSVIPLINMDYIRRGIPNEYVKLEWGTVRVEEEDILILWDGAYAGEIHSGKQGVLGSTLMKCSPDERRLQLAYSFYELKSYEKQLRDLTVGMGIPHVNPDILKNIRLLVPPEDEQHTIATFLDRETERIDNLIEMKKRQIEMLQEKSTSLISHVVTKGLDPNVKMRDSGIEWLGRIPTHWKVKRLRYLGSCQNGINIGAEYFGTGHPFVSYGDVFKNRELPDNVDGLVRSSVADRERYSVRAGDVFFTRTSETIEEIGFSSVCLHSINEAVFAGFLIRFRPFGSDLDTVFSKYYFQNNFLRAFFVKEMNIVTRASLSQDLLKQMPVLIAPLEEQAQIASFLDRETRLIHSLIEKIKKTNELLREYRTSLILAAVTGKIDLLNNQSGYRIIE